MSYEVKLQKYPIEQKSYYKLRRAVDKNTGKVVKYVYQYNMEKIEELKLLNHLNFNIDVFKDAKQIQDGENLMLIKQVKQVADLEQKSKRVKMIYTAPFQHRLNDYISKNQSGLGEMEAFSMITQIVDALYSVSEYYCFNLRVQNFVIAPSKNPNRINDNEGQVRHRVKLQSIPFVSDRNKITKQFNQLDSPLIYKRQYQPPQAYHAQRSKQQLHIKELQQTLVWNIGCIWLHLLYGKHLLKDEESIQKFCKGNGENGIFSVRSLGIKRDKMTKKQHKKLLQKMLQYYSQDRMSLKVLFSDPLLAQNIKKYEDSIPVPINNNIFSTYENFFEKNSKYLTMDGLLILLVQTITKNQKDYVITANEKKSFKKLQILQKNKDNNFQKKHKQSIQNPQQNTYTQNELTLKQLQEFLRPYKFYYDKTIFLSHFPEKIIKKLVQISNKKRDSSRLLNSFQSWNDLIFTFYFQTFFMRLVYLNILRQNLKLKRNIFCIPNTKFNIRNNQFNNQELKWCIFNDSAIYLALSNFIKIQFDKCQLQYCQLLKKMDSSLGSKCKGKVSIICGQYKKYCINKFLSPFQQILKVVLDIVDQFSVTNFKRPFCYQSEKINQNMRNIGLMLFSIIIQNQHVFKPENYEKYFGRFMITQQPEFIQGKGSILKSKQGDQNKYEQFTFRYLGQRGKEIFNFEIYQKFLQQAQKQKVAEQVQYLLKKFPI